MKQAFLCFVIGLVSTINIAATLTTPQPDTKAFATSLGNAFKNHATMPKNTAYQAMATTYGGEDV